MRIPGLLAAVPLLAGACWGTFGTPPAAVGAALPLLCAVAAAAWNRRAWQTTSVVLAVGFFTAGATLAADARREALHAPLRTLLDNEIGGFAIDSAGPEVDHEPVLVRAMVNEDAAERDGFVALRVSVGHVMRGGAFPSAPGAVSLSVSGEAAARQLGEWRAGRTVEFPATFRRPARYLNDGVPDLERNLALDGTTLFGSVKSGLLIDVVAHGSPVDEFTAQLRAHVRRAVRRWVSPHDPVASGIVTAILIGDRTGLADEVRERLQAAGTYHVIAISGGNIAILAALILGLLMVAGIHGRAAALLAIVGLLIYAHVATSGPSVWRATLMAVLYLAARVIDHRTAPWQAAAVAAAAMIVVRPLDIRDAGFLLTFGATAALLEGARLGLARQTRHRALGWFAASVTASVAAEVVLLPVSAQIFSRVTGAGLMLNLIAVPAMTIAQVAGLVVVMFDAVPVVASVAGRAASAGASTLVESARLVDLAPWLTSRVPPPGLALVVCYYVAVGLALYGTSRRVRVPAAVAAATALLVIVGAVAPTIASTPAPGLRLTMFDVGQGEAMVLEGGGQALQIDAGGAPFAGGSFDIGARVLLPALWARGIRRLDAMLVTHGDPDHIGGAPVLVDELEPQQYWEGIEVPRHTPSRELRALAAAARARHAVRRAGETLAWGGARLRVLHPPEPDWERPRVRNDDSVVLEIVYGAVAVLLTGDISAEVERGIAPLLTPSRVRVLKVAHHGSRTSTSMDLLETWRPHIALISAGRGNSFGHPTPDVLRRLDEIGARVFRTDRDGQITLETDGRDVRVRTFVGGAQ